MKPTLTGLATAEPRESVLAVAAAAAATPSSETTATTMLARLNRTDFMLTLRELAAPSNMRPDSGIGFWAAGKAVSRGNAEGLGALLDALVELGACRCDERRFEALRDRLLRDHALGDVLARRQLEHHVEQRRLDDRAQA